MEYELLAVGKADELIGYVIRKVSLPSKLEHTNIYLIDVEGEAEAAVNDVAELNELAELRRHWPFPADPEVEALLTDLAFAPIEYDEVAVPDMEKSNIVYDVKPGRPIEAADGSVAFGPDEIKYDETGKPSVNWIASNVVYKKERTPKGSQGKSRIEAACEQVARQRMAADHG